MTEDMGLAQLSLLIVYLSMAIITMAMISFAISFAGSRTSKLAARDRVPALVGSVASSESSAVSDSAPVSELPKGRRAANVGMSLTWLAFAMLLVGVVMRGIWAGRVPWGNMYEFSITAAVAVLAVFLGMSTRRDLRWLGLFVVIAVELTLGLAVTVLYTEAAQLVPALKSYWLLIHVSAAIICSGAFTIAAATAGLSILRIRAEHKAGDAQVTGWLARVPSGEKLELMTQRIIAFTFPLWTFAVVAGAIWAENAWGRYWGWDPKETWAFITWVVFAAYLHARSTQGWRGTRASLIVLAGWLAFMINYFGVNFLASSLHSYAGVS